MDCYRIMDKKSDPKDATVLFWECESCGKKKYIRWY